MGNHRAEKRGSRRASSETTITAAPVAAKVGAGRRRAAKRAPLFRALPPAPVLLGVAALAVSAGGALTVAHPQISSSADHRPARLTQASALTGDGAIASSNLLGSRKGVVSRDSRRTAQQDAADDTLVAQAEAQSQQRDAALASLAKKAEQQAAKIRLNQWTLPVVGYHLTAGFGDVSGLWASVHTGLDFAAPSGTPIMAIANGTISSTGYDGSYGNKTVETLDDGTELWYCHQTSFIVSPGDTVRAGQVIGYIGSTGNTTGPHLHLEVRPGGGDPVDPYQALVVHGLQP